MGKIGIDDNVLRKPGKLTEAEYEHIKTHAEIGYKILSDIKQLDDVLPVVLHHHEQWDGRGYPHGLAGDDIPLWRASWPWPIRSTPWAATARIGKAWTTQSSTASCARVPASNGTPKWSRRSSAPATTFAKSRRQGQEALTLDLCTQWA